MFSPTYAGADGTLRESASTFTTKPRATLQTTNLARQMKLKTVIITDSLSVVITI